MTIDTDRLIIRPFEVGDREVVEQMLMGNEFMEYSNSGKMGRREAAQRFNELIVNTKNNIGKRAVILKSNELIVGYCGVEPFSLNGKSELELGYRLMPEFRGMGLATEAAKAILSVIEPPVYAYVSSHNVKSINVLGKLGFSKFGVYTVGIKNYELFQYM